MIHDADTGDLVRSGVAFHRSGTTVNPEIWYTAFREALKQAGGLVNVKVLAVAGQQHGLVALDEGGKVVRDAILWNDTRSAGDAADLIKELGGGDEEAGKSAWAHATGSVPVASLTVTKLRWLARNEPEAFERTAAIALPHDWLSWKMCKSKGIDCLFTDRSEASGTGYFSGESNEYLSDLLELAAGKKARTLTLPRIVPSAEAACQARVEGKTLLVGPGCGDNAGASLGLDLQPGQVAVSIGTSGVVSLVSDKAVHDANGEVTGFSDATGRFLPLIGTLNASRVFDAMATALGVDYERFSELALSALPGAEGLTFIPYLAGERTPNLPTATGSLIGLTSMNMNRANMARAAVESVLCSLGNSLEIMRRQGVGIESVILIGGGARLEAVRRIAPTVLGLPCTSPERGEYVADGAARQAAWVLAGTKEPPQWNPRLFSSYKGEHKAFILERYNEFKDMYVDQGRLGLE